jgi:hypothetical protein
MFSALTRLNARNPAERLLLGGPDPTGFVKQWKKSRVPDLVLVGVGQGVGITRAIVHYA